VDLFGKKYQTENLHGFLDIYNKNMKKQLISEEFKRMQKLAGILDENTLGTKLDVSIGDNSFIVPYEELLYKIGQDHGNNDLYYEAEQAIFDKNFKALVNVLKDYSVYEDYKHMLSLNENV